MTKVGVKREAVASLIFNYLKLFSIQCSLNVLFEVSLQVEIQCFNHPLQYYWHLVSQLMTDGCVWFLNDCFDVNS